MLVHDRDYIYSLNSALLTFADNVTVDFSGMYVGHASSRNAVIHTYTHIHTCLWHEVDCPMSDTVTLLCSHKHDSMNRNSVLNFMFNSVTMSSFKTCTCICAAYFYMLRNVVCLCV